MASEKTTIGITCGTWVISLLVIFPLLALWTGRSLDWLCTHFAGHAVHVPYWLDLLATIVLNGAIIAFNVIVEILRLFM